MKAVCDTMMKTLFATVVLCLAAVVFGLAQPAGEQPKGEPDPFGPGAPGGPGEGKAGAKGKADAAPEVVKADPLAIQVLRDSNPTTPLELMRAAQAVLQYGRPDECKRYLAKLLEKPPADDALTALPAKFADLLLRIAKQKEVQPEGKQVADLVMAASQRAAENPERINALVAQLSSANRNERADALVKLAESGRHVVTPLLRVLADAKRAKEFPYVQAALIRLAGATEAPLVGALEGSSDALKAQIALVLGYMKSERATPHLVRLATAGKSAADVREAAQAALMRISGAVPDEHDARQYLANEAARLLRGDLPYEADVENQVELWSWDEAKQEVTSRKLPKADAAVLLASRAAKDWYAVSGDNAAQRMMLLTNLELAKVLGGLDQALSLESEHPRPGPLPKGEGEKDTGKMPVPPEVVSQVLADAMKQGRVPAAIAAVEVLGRIGDSPALAMHHGHPSPLTEALTFSDRRVRLAAAFTSIKLADGGPFAGAGRAIEMLGWASATSGTSRALVAHPRGEEAQTLIGYANSLGYEGIAATTGRALAEEAFANPDVEFILISDAIDQPPVKDLVQWLRRDFRTARMPVGVMARGEQMEALRNELAGDAFTTVFPRLYSTEVAAKEVERLLAIAGRNLVGRDERIVQAQSALALVAELAKNDRTLARYDLIAQEAAVIRGLYNPAIAADAANVLALFGTPKAQAALVEFASQNARLLSDRQAAAEAFARAVKARGLLLTQQQIAVQYERYNASEKLDRPTQELLGVILDAVESTAIARGELREVSNKEE